MKSSATNELRTKMRRKNWNANKRTIISSYTLVDEDVLNEIEWLQTTHEYESALELIESCDQELVKRDHRALNLKSLALLGLERYSEASQALSEANASLQADRGSILRNLVGTLLKEGKVDAAIEAALAARECAPKAVTTHINLMIAYSYSNRNDKYLSVREAIKDMKNMCPQWRENRVFWTYLLTDIDCSKIRKLGDFKELFGIPPEHISI